MALVAAMAVLPVRSDSVAVTEVIVTAANSIEVDLTGQVRAEGAGMPAMRVGPVGREFVGTHGSAVVGRNHVVRRAP